MNIVKSFVAHGLDCLVARHSTVKMLMGYVRVFANNPLHGMNYDDIPGIRVHGGLTFSGELPGRSGWWIGFDAAHYGDVLPLVAEEHGIQPGQKYRDIPYMVSEVTKLAEQVSLYRR